MTAAVRCSWTAAAALLVATAAVCAVRIDPDGPSVSVTPGNTVQGAFLPFNYSEDGLTTVKTAPGCAPEQVHSVLLAQMKQ